MDSVRVGRSVRALRRRRGLRQLDVAAAVGIGQATISRLERGHLEGMRLATVASVCSALDARLDLSVSWRGAGLDRLLDERHAALTGAAAARLRAAGWQVEFEVSYARYGERGSIDLLALRPVEGIAVVVEIKSELASIEETLRRLDAKARMAAAIVAERFGWRPRVVGRIIVLADTTTNRRRVARHAPVLEAALPLRGSSLYSALSAPLGVASRAVATGSPATSRSAMKPPDPRRAPIRLAGLWFLPLIHDLTGKRDTNGPDRIRRPRASGYVQHASATRGAVARR